MRRNKSNMKNKPLISVVMATFNEPSDMIKKSIGSILNQTYINLELLIFDDSTNVDTKAAIDEFASDSRIAVNRFSEKKRFVPSLNMGLEQARGKYIVRMDGDDISLPDRLEKEVEYLETHPQISVVGGQIDIIDEKGETISHRAYPTGGLKLWLFSCLRNPLAHPTIVMRRELIDKGYRYNEKLEMSEDLDLWLRLMNDGYKIANLNDTILKYRIQANFNNKRTDAKQRNYTAKVRKSNFSKKHLLHGILSTFSGWLFAHVSAKSISKIYDKENQNKKISAGRN